MLGFDDEVGLEEASSQRRWTVGRLINDLAIVMVAVPFLLKALVPQERLPSVGDCGNTPENYCLFSGLILLAVCPVAKLLRAANRAGEQVLAELSSRSEPDPKRSRSIPKPPPLDDF